MTTAPNTFPDELTPEDVERINRLTPAGDEPAGEAHKVGRQLVAAEKHLADLEGRLKQGDDSVTAEQLMLARTAVGRAEMLLAAAEEADQAREKAKREQRERRDRIRREAPPKIGAAARGVLDDFELAVQALEGLARSAATYTREARNAADVLGTRGVNTAALICQAAMAALHGTDARRDTKAMRSLALAAEQVSLDLKNARTGGHLTEIRSRAAKAPATPTPRATQHRQLAAQGMTQREIAEHTGHSQPTVSRDLNQNESDQPNPESPTPQTP